MICKTWFDKLGMILKVNLNEILNYGKTELKKKKLIVWMCAMRIKNKKPDDKIVLNELSFESPDTLITKLVEFFI